MSRDIFVARMGRVEDRLRDLGIELPPPKQHVANYLGCKLSGELLFVSARVSELRGEVGTDIDLPEAYEAARSTLIDILSIIKNEFGDLDRISSVDKMIGFVRSAQSFTEQPMVVDGASDLLVEIWGDSGRHARTATGVAQLPFGAAVQLELILTVDAF